jgi:hypothetical protein
VSPETADRPKPVSPFEFWVVVFRVEAFRRAVRLPFRAGVGDGGSLRLEAELVKAAPLLFGGLPSAINQVPLFGLSAVLTEN